MRKFFPLIFCSMLSFGQSCVSEPETVSNPTVEPPTVSPPKVEPPPVSPPPKAPPPALPAPEVVWPLEVTTKTLKRPLAPDEISYFWARDCSPNSPMFTEDPLGAPLTDRLIMERYPDISEHLIFVRLNDDWPGFIEEAWLELYLINFNCDAFLPLIPIWPTVYRVSKDWRPGPPDPNTWRAYCYNEIPAKQSGDDGYDTPGKGKWYDFDITTSCRVWQSGAEKNYGLVIQDSNDWYVLAFAGPLYLDAALRPYLEFKYRPALELKLPLPGGWGWLVTTEAGGADCGSDTVDVYHTGAGFYSLDFAPFCVAPEASQVATKAVAKVPILAAAAGVVSAAGYSDSNGNYVVLKHPAGFTTCYLHLESAPEVRVDEEIVCGDELGIMGNTGASFGTHLHFGVKWQGDGSQGAAPLANQVLLEGRPLADFKIRCQSGVRVTYFVSTNAP